MKNSLLAISIAAAGLFAVPALSHAADGNGGFFINGSIGDAQLNEGIYDDSDTGYQVNAGYRWALSPAFAFGVEGGYTDLGNYSPDVPVINPGPLLQDAEMNGWTVGVNALWGLGDSWYISGRTGVFMADIKGDYLLGSGAPTRVDDSSSDWYLGGGFGYNFSNNFGLGLSYDRYNAGKRDLNLNSGLFSVTGEVRF